MSAGTQLVVLSCRLLSLSAGPLQKQQKNNLNSSENPRQSFSERPWISYRYGASTFVVFDAFGNNLFRYSGAPIYRATL